jgi:hypothetical protein
LAQRNARSTYAPLEEINDNPEFVAREISKEEFEVTWEKAAHEMKN